MKIEMEPVGISRVDFTNQLRIPKVNLGVQPPKSREENEKQQSIIQERYKSIMLDRIQERKVILKESPETPPTTKVDPPIVVLVPDNNSQDRMRLMGEIIETYPQLNPMINLSKPIVPVESKTESNLSQSVSKLPIQETSFKFTRKSKK